MFGNGPKDGERAEEARRRAEEAFFGDAAGAASARTWRRTVRNQTLFLGAAARPVQETLRLFRHRALQS